MARYASGGITGAGSTTLPLSSLYGSAGVRPFVTAIHLYNTTAVAVSLRLVRLTTLGTRGAAWTAAPLTGEDPNAAVSTVTGTHTAAPTLGNDLGYRCTLGAAVGSGIIWTFPERHLTVPAVANAGLGIIVETGTGQACQVVWEWAE